MSEKQQQAVEYLRIRGRAGKDGNVYAVTYHLITSLQAQLTEARAEIERLKALANCAIELRTWFLDNEFWNDENSEDIFPILEKYGLVEEIEYDPNLHGFVDNADTGDPIWHFPELPTPGGEQE